MDAKHKERGSKRPKPKSKQLGERHDKRKDRGQRKKQYKWVINVYCRMQYQAREPLIDVTTTLKGKEKGQQSQKTLLIPMYLPSPGEKM